VLTAPTLVTAPRPTFERNRYSMTPHPTMPRPIFWNAFLSGLAAPTALYQAPPPYWVYIPTTTVAQTFAQVGLLITSAMESELHDRGAAPETAERSAFEAA
jgi:hypothetical protein